MSRTLVRTLCPLILLLLPAVGEPTEAVDETCVLQLPNGHNAGDRGYDKRANTSIAARTIGQTPVASAVRMVKSENANGVDKSTSSKLNSMASSVVGIADTGSMVAGAVNPTSSVDAAAAMEMGGVIDMHQRSVTRVLCVGDSITEGGLTSQKYPDQLQSLLGPHYNVIGVGASGASAQKCRYHPPSCLLGVDGSHHSFWSSWKLNSSLGYASSVGTDIIIMMFGTNDGWDCPTLDICESDYRRDYPRLIAKYQNLPSRPLVYIAVPPPVYIQNNAFNVSQRFVRERLRNAIPEIAKNLSLPVPIDIFSAFSSVCPHINSSGCPFMQTDGVHPNNAGNGVIARAIQNRIR